MSLMSSLFTGVSGLSSSQSGLNTTGHNLANVETKGYVRQQQIQTDTHYVNLQSNSYGLQQIGIGTSVAAIRQVREEFLDKAYRQSVGRQGFYEEQYKAVSEVESFFGEFSTNESFQTSIQGLWSAISEFGKEPESIVSRATFINSAVSFLDKANIIKGQLDAYQTSLNTQIKESVSRINDIGDKIFELNKSIMKREAGGSENANDFRDERNVLLDELASLINIRYSEDINGVVRISTEGQPFVTEDRVEHMTTVKEAPDSNMLKVVWKFFDDTEVFNFGSLPSTDGNTDIGSLKGLLLSRGNNIAKYTDIPVRENFSSDLDFEDAKAKYNLEINSSVIKNAQAQFDQLVHGITTMINDVLCPNTTATFVGEGGITYTNVKVLDENNAPVGMGEGNDYPGTELFSRKSTDRYTKVNEEDASGNLTGKVFYVYNEENSNSTYSLYTLGELQVNPELRKNYSLLPLSNSGGTADYSVEVIDELLSKWQNTFASLSPNDLDKCNINDYYINFIGDFANRGETLKTVSESQGRLADGFDNNRQAVMSVSSDEELTNMIKYQHAYNAAARYINVVSEMLEHLITRLT